MGCIHGLRVEIVADYPYRVVTREYEPEAGNAAKLERMNDQSPWSSVRERQR